MNVSSVRDEDIIESYRRLGSLVKVGRELGIGKSTVASRLHAAGEPVAQPGRKLKSGDRPPEGRKPRQFRRESPPPKGVIYVQDFQPAHLAAMKKMLANGSTYNEIAELVGVSKFLIARVVRENSEFFDDHKMTSRQRSAEASKRRTNMRAEHIREIKRMTGATNKELAKHYSMNEGIIARLLKRSV